MSGGDGQRLSLLSVALFLSLAVNFFMAGWFIGRQPGFGPPFPPPPFDRFFNEHIRQSLSPEGAKRMEDAFDAMRDHFADRRNPRYTNVTCKLLPAPVVSRDVGACLESIASTCSDKPQRRRHCDNVPRSHSK